MMIRRSIFLFWCALTVHVMAEDYVDPNYAAKPNQTPQLVIDAQGFSGKINRLAISDDGRWLAGVADKTVRVWNLESGKLHAVLRGYQEPDGFHIGYIDTLTFAPDNQHLIVGVSDNSSLGSTRVYDLREPGEIKQLINGHTGCTRGVAFTRSGNRFATWGCDGFVVFYQKGANGDWQIDFRLPWGGVSTSRKLFLPDDIFAFTDDEQHLAFMFHSPIVISVSQRRALTNLSEVPQVIRDLKSTYGQATSAFTRFSHGDWVPSLKTASKIDRIRAVGSAAGYDKSKRVYFAASWAENGDAVAIHKHSYNVTAVAWNEKARLVASADKLGRIHIWDPLTGENLYQPIRSVTSSIWNVRWSADGRNLLFSNKNYPTGKWHFNRMGGTDRQLSLDTFQVSKTDVRMPDHPVKPAAYHPQLGNIELKSATYNSSGNRERDSAIVDWDFHVGFPGQGKKSQSLIPWGLSQRESAIRNFRIRVPKKDFGMVRCMRFVEYPGCVSGSSCIIGTDTGKLFEATIEVMPSGTAELHLRKQFLGHTAAITSFDVSPNQKTFVSSSLDGTMRIYPLTKAVPCGDIDFLHDGTGVVEVPRGGNSARAGILAEDTMLTFGDGAFYERIRKQQAGFYRPGDRISITINRGVQMNERRRVSVDVALSESPQLVMPLTSILLARTGQWVSWTPEGYYDSSPSGGKYVGWHINRNREQTARFFPVDHFQNQYYQPKVVRYAVIEYSSTRAINRADQELDSFSADVPLASATASQLGKRLPPQIDILSPSPNSVSNDSRVKVISRIRIHEDETLRNVRYQVDGHAVPGRPRISREQTTGGFKEIWYEQLLDLTAGKRGIGVQAVCSNETRADCVMQCMIKKIDRQRAQQGTTYLLAIGISKYANDAFSLKYGSQDAAQFAQAWQNLPRRSPKNIEMRVLQNDQATCQGIREDGLQWLLEQPIKPNDIVIVFLSGHALYDRNEDWYFGGYDLDPNRLISTGISDAELDNVLRKIPTNLIMFSDTCHAGGFETTKIVSRNPQSEVNIWRGRGHVVFASCLPQESSLESDQWKGGAFTTAILKFLRSMDYDYDHNGELTFDEMALFVKGEVRRMTKNQQSPAVERPATVSSIPFTRSR